jgi:hypothetical protein
MKLPEYFDDFDLLLGILEQTLRNGLRAVVQTRKFRKRILEARSSTGQLQEKSSS